MSGNGSSAPSGVDPAERPGEEPVAERMRPPPSAPEPPARPEVEVPPGSGDAPAEPPLSGYHLYGVVRSRSWSGWRAAPPEELIRIGHRDLEALVHRAPFHIPELELDRVRAHQRLIEGVMHSGTILPAPYGVVFREREGVQRFLQEQYLTLDEALSFLRGCWELRLHISPASGGESGPERNERAMHIYSELRRAANAAIPFPSGQSRILSAAFLIDRGIWIEFIDRAHALGDEQSDMVIDITGPWPPYDFVKIVG